MGDPWVIQPHEHAKYAEHFRNLNPVGGMLSGEQAKKFMLQSQLAPPILGQIWGLADANADGKLNLQEFSVACKIINLKLHGIEVPKALPPSLLASLSPTASMPQKPAMPPVAPIPSVPILPAAPKQTPLIPLNDTPDLLIKNIPSPPKSLPISPPKTQPVIPPQPQSIIPQQSVLPSQPIIPTQPIMATQPIIPSQPVMTQPIIPPQPVMNQPIIPPQSVMATQPIIPPQPVMTQPIIPPHPVMTQPIMPPQSIMATQPIIPTQPIMTQPIIPPQSIIPTQPIIPTMLPSQTSAPSQFSPPKVLPGSVPVLPAVGLISPPKISPISVQPVTSTPIVAQKPEDRGSALTSPLQDSPMGVTSPLSVEWAIPQAQKLKYTQLFNATDRAKSGAVSGVQARSIMLQSRLPQNILAQIWALADLDSDGKLGCEEFVLAMYLCERATQGETVPTKLPIEMIPPTFRRDSQSSMHSSASFEEKRRENMARGQAELERRRSVLADALMKEKAERERLERAELERKERLRQEALEEAQRKQKEEQEKREAARKEMERQCQLEWEMKRTRELEALRAEEQSKVLKLKAKTQSVQSEISLANSKIEQLGKSIRETRTAVATVKCSIDNMRSERDTHMSEMSQLKTKVKDLNAKQIAVNKEKADLDAKAKATEGAGEDGKLNMMEVTLKQLKEKMKHENVKIMGQEPMVPLPIERMFITLPESNTECAFCQYFLHYLQVELSDIKTEEHIKAVVEEACTHLPNSVQDQCKTFVTEYGPAVVALLVQEIDPASVCPALGMCPNAEVRKVSINASKSNCPLCLFAVEQLETMLKNNRTETSIRNALDNLCTHLSQKLRTECTDFVDTYSNQLVEMLVADLNAQEVCVYLKLCSDDSHKSDPMKLSHSSIDKFFEEPHRRGDRNMFKVPVLPAYMVENANGDIATNEIHDRTANGRPIRRKVGQKPMCVVCEFIMKEIDDQIKDRKNEDEIKKIVHGVCQHMPKSVRADCDKFVEKYADLVISLLAQELDPNEVCQELKLCDPTDKTGVAKVKVEILDCAICETFALALKKIMVNDKTNQEALELIEKACNMLPAKYNNRCHAMMDVYGESVIKLIEDMGPKAICREIGICSERTGNILHMYKANRH